MRPTIPIHPNMSRFAHVAAYATAALEIVVPAECAGCGQWGTALCPGCTRLLDAAPIDCTDSAPLLTGADGPVLTAWALGEYRGALRRIVIDWKTGRRGHLRPAMLAAGRSAGARLWPVARAATGAEDLLVVPAPSGRARRRHGLLVAAELADAVAAGLAQAARDDSAHTMGSPGRIASADLLRRAGGPRRQRGSTARQRARNRRSLPRLRADVPPGSAVLLVDDVVTTGATLAACAAALAAAGVGVVGAFVVAGATAPGR